MSIAHRAMPGGASDTKVHAHWFGRDDLETTDDLNVSGPLRPKHSHAVERKPGAQARTTVWWTAGRVSIYPVQAFAPTRQASSMRRCARRLGLAWAFWSGSACAERGRTAGFPDATVSGCASWTWGTPAVIPVGACTGSDRRSWIGAGPSCERVRDGVACHEMTTMKKTAPTSTMSSFIGKRGVLTGVGMGRLFGAAKFVPIGLYWEAIAIYRKVVELESRDVKKKKRLRDWIWERIKKHTACFEGVELWLFVWMMNVECSCNQTEVDWHL